MRLNLKFGQQCGLKDIYKNKYIVTYIYHLQMTHQEKHVLYIQVWINYLFQ